MSTTSSYHSKLVFVVNNIISYLDNVEGFSAKPNESNEFIKMLFMHWIEQKTVLNKSFRHKDLENWVRYRLDYDELGDIDYDEYITEIVDTCLDDISPLCAPLDINIWGVYNVTVESAVAVLEYFGDYRILTWSKSDDANNFPNVSEDKRCADGQSWFR